MEGQNDAPAEARRTGTRRKTNPARRAHSPSPVAHARDARRCGGHRAAGRDAVVFVAPAMARDLCRVVVHRPVGRYRVAGDCPAATPSRSRPGRGHSRIRDWRRVGTLRCESRGILARRRLDVLVPRQPEDSTWKCCRAASRSPVRNRRRRQPPRRKKPRGVIKMISPLDRARLLDAEMRLQRAWLELSLREMSTAARGSPWASCSR